MNSSHKPIAVQSPKMLEDIINNKFIWVWQGKKHIQTIQLYVSFPTLFSEKPTVQEVRQYKLEREFLNTLRAFRENKISPPDLQLASIILPSN